MLHGGRSHSNSNDQHSAKFRLAKISTRNEFRMDESLRAEDETGAFHVQGAFAFTTDQKKDA